MVNKFLYKFLNTFKKVKKIFAGFKKIYGFSCKIFPLLLKKILIRVFPVKFKNLIKKIISKIYKKGIKTKQTIKSKKTISLNYDVELNNKFNELESIILQQKPKERDLNLIKKKSLFIKNSTPERFDNNTGNSRININKYLDERIKLKPILKYTNDWYWLKNRTNKKINNINGVSIVIPVYNREHFLLLHSLLLLTRPPKLIKRY